ncbi:MAG TPA: transcription termination/antitermination NusG family protein, partial [Bryobacteraceae bacterium]|nr:transcription termination/antitermination NusG family protein [Bryobacteraceae bacterium]
MGLTLRELCPDATASVASRWFAVTVKHQHERTVKSALEAKQLEALAPMYRARRRWSDRETEVDLPLFGGYVFCR